MKNSMGSKVKLNTLRNKSSCMTVSSCSCLYKEYSEQSVNRLTVRDCLVHL